MPCSGHSGRSRLPPPAGGQIPRRCLAVLKSGWCHLSPRCPPRNKLRLGAKIIQDKTFGLKNKKGAKQQKFIKAAAHQVQSGQQNPHQAKDDKKQGLQELKELFAPGVAAHKASNGASPSSFLNFCLLPLLILTLVGGSRMQQFLLWCFHGDFLVP
uniref:Uncharacterized protein n=1 Tax=Equus asinus asinus TaxID=83772 RepID=A0A8C4L659_EQUAS